MNDFANLCPGCGACKKVCPFMAEYGTPDRIFAESPDVSFYCTSCRRCDGVCPQGLSPSAAFFEVKRQMVREDTIPAPVRKSLESARRFAKAGQGFPFSLYKGADTVFWPGCGLAANRPGLVRRVRHILASRLHKPVGLVLDCCFDPVYGLGDAETALAALAKIGLRLRKHGVRRVITGCLNCHKLLSQRLGLECLFVLEVLPPEIFEKQGTGPAYLHHPCPASRWDEIRNRAERAARGAIVSPGTDVQPPPLPDVPLSAAMAGVCCGNGGSLSSLHPALADRFLNRIMAEAAGRKMVTYCTGCQNRFLKGGADAVHLLEWLPGVKPRRTIPSPLAQWANRFFLAMVERLSTGKWTGAIILLLLVSGGFYLNQQNLFSAETLTNLLDRFPVLAPLIFLGIYAVAPSLLLPSIPLTLAAGFFWGPLWGVALSIAGATLGACPPFFLARHLFQNAVKEKVSPERWEWLQEKVLRHGWKTVAFTRLVPLFPFNLLNYLFGLTPIPFGQYLVSTFVFMLPACIAFVAFGSSLGELILHGSARGVIIGAVVAVCALLISAALRPFFRKIGEDKTGVLHDQIHKENRP